ncbi:MAG: outer membrane protein assembly factor BamE (lipoprotein component of BamABCDE complex) [Paracoccaceae bacterium]|jgi:outer membrane protein assembly factor BamE (lipoprotein component of BamABCDE complex)
MSGRVRTLHGAAAALALLAVAGCAPIISTHGYAPTEDRLSEVEPGVDGAEAVMRKIGRPSTAGVIRSDAWYYVASTFETEAWHAPEAVDRRVVAVRFGPDGLVASVERFGLEDGKIISLATRVTPTYGREMTIVQQIFGNLGNINANSGAGGLFGQ